MRKAWESWCWSKKMLAVDYAIMMFLLALIIIFAVLGIDAMYISAFAAVWAVQLGYSSGCYYAKAKAENMIKLPLMLFKSLPPEIMEKIDPNDVIPAIFGLKD